MSEDVALTVKHLNKDFIVPHERKNTLKEWALHFHKPSYKKFHALHDIDFEVSRGEFFGIVGRNGSGKSTLLKIIGGIYQPTDGSVKVNGTLTPFIELGIGFNPELTGRENIFLNGAILGLTRKEVQQKYDEVVEFAELKEFMDQKLKNYSSGMQVRLAFSIAIQAHNDILLIDEVLAVGDANFQRKCFKVFREIKNSDKTVVFVTHDMGMIQEFCDRALMIQDSKIVAIGAPREIAQRYDLANATTVSKSTEGKLHRPTDPVIRITELRFMSNDKGSSRFSLEDEIRAELKINVKRATKIQVNLFFIGSNGEYLAGINSLNASRNYEPPTGVHTLTCTIQPGQLTKGEYSVGIAIYTMDDVPEIIDIIDQAYDTIVPQITITESSRYQDGKFYIKGQWSGIESP